MVESAIDTLAALQSIDQRRRERQLEIEEIESRSAELEADLAAKRAEVDSVRETSGLAGIRRRELEALLQEEERRIMNSRMRLDRIRTERELEAARAEIEGLRESKSRHEEELLEMMEEGETVDGGLEEAEAALAELDTAASEHRTKSEGRVEQLQREIEAEAAERERTAAELPDNLRRRYEQIFNRRAGLAVVRVRDGNCLGCNMRVPPQLYNEVLRREKIHNCPDCQRILFFREDTEADRQEA